MKHFFLTNLQLIKMNMLSIQAFLYHNVIFVCKINSIIRVGNNEVSLVLQVEFSYRLAWSYSHARCDANAIAKRKVIGDGDLRWACTYGCSGDIASASKLTICLSNDLVIFKFLKVFSSPFVIPLPH